MANWNGSNGVRVSTTRIGVVLRGNSTNKNIGSGIEVPGTGMSILDNTAAGNGSYGISVGDGNIIRGNSTALNDAGGIFAVTGNTVSGNIAWSPERRDYASTEV